MSMAANIPMLGALALKCLLAMRHATMKCLVAILDLGKANHIATQT